MKSALNPHFETLLLLVAARQDKNWQGEVVAELDTLGIDGGSFFRRYFPVVQQYYKAFLKKKKDLPGARLLNENDEIVLSLYADIFWRHPGWFDDVETVPEDELLAAARQAVAEEGEDAIDAVEKLGLRDQTKWQAMLLLQRPRQQLGMVADAVRANLPAFEKARAKVENELTALLDAFDGELADPLKGRLLQITTKAVPGGEIVPTLALPVAVLALSEVSFYGLLSNKAAGVGEAPGCDELRMGAKALSDKSKMEILLELKDGSLYNLEIAERVGLTPATVSHHMGALLTAGLVDLEKREGKVFYQLSRGGVLRFLQGFGELLL